MTFGFRHVAKTLISTFWTLAFRYAIPRRKNAPSGAFYNASTDRYAWIGLTEDGCIIRGIPGTPTDCRIWEQTPVWAVSQMGSLSDTGETAGVPHPFAGLLSPSKVSQVALRESR